MLLVPVPNTIRSLCYLRKNTEYPNPFSANPTKWPNTLKQLVGNLPTNCLIVFDHFVRLAPKELNITLLMATTLLHIRLPPANSAYKQFEDTLH